VFVPIQWSKVSNNGWRNRLDDKEDPAQLDMKYFESAQQNRNHSLWHTTRMTLDTAYSHSSYACLGVLGKPIFNGKWNGRCGMTVILYSRFLRVLWAAA
jgi:hypothetical protein